MKMLSALCFTPLLSKYVLSIQKYKFSFNNKNTKLKRQNTPVTISKTKFSGSGWF